MRRSTAAVVGTLTGAALIIGVRMSVQPPAGTSAQAPVADVAGDPPLTDSSSPASGKSGDSGKSGGSKNGLKDGVFKGTGVKEPYGTIQVSIKIEDGKITAASATYPTEGNSGVVNPPAITKLKQSTLSAQSAKVDAVSGATFTSKAYAESLQAALDAAKA